MQQKEKKKVDKDRVWPGRRSRELILLSGPRLGRFRVGYNNNNNNTNTNNEWLCHRTRAWRVVHCNRWFCRVGGNLHHGEVGERDGDNIIQTDRNTAEESVVDRWLSANDKNNTKGGQAVILRLVTCQWTEKHVWTWVSDWLHTFHSLLLLTTSY